LLVSLSSYGVFSLQQGYYWDDWAFAWTRVNMGAEGIIQLFSATRPMRGWMEAFLTTILGTHPAVWQFYAIFMQWLAAVACWWFLLELWPSRKWQASLAALFFLVYPGFTQQPLAMTYHYYWTFTALFFLSLGLMVQSVQTGRLKTLQLAGAVGIGGLVLWAMEYLFGLELLRVMVIWIALGSSIRDGKSRLKQAALYYIPYLVILCVYLYWRFFVYQSARYTLEALDHQGAASLFSPFALVWDILKALPLASFGAWIKILQQPYLGQDISLIVAIIYGLVFLGGVFGLLYYFRSFRAEPGSSTVGWMEQAGLAVALLLFAGLPFHLLGLPVRLSFPEDRFTLPFSLGAALLLVVLLDLIKDHSRRFTLAALIIPLAMTLQIHNTDLYRKEWQLQRAFIWQLVWRAPDIQPGTTFLAEDGAVFPHNDDEAFAFLINWAYTPKTKSAKLPYEYFLVSARIGYQLPGLQKGLPISMNHFAAAFSGTTDQVLVLRFSPNSCLRVLDPRFDADAPLLPRGANTLDLDSETAFFALPRTTAQALALSAPAALISDGSSPLVPEWLFGAEPEHRWCYYFQKADLARQQGDWVRVARLGDQAFNFPYYPDDPAEYLPFIEAYGRLGRIEEARSLSKKAADLNPALRPMLCAAWQRLEESGKAAREIIQSEIQSLKYCPGHIEDLE